MILMILIILLLLQLIKVIFKGFHNIANNKRKSHHYSLTILRTTHQLLSPTYTVN